MEVANCEYMAYLKQKFHERSDNSRAQRTPRDRLQPKLPLTLCFPRCQSPKKTLSKGPLNSATTFGGTASPSSADMHPPIIQVGHNTPAGSFSLHKTPLVPLNVFITSFLRPLQGHRRL